MKFHGSAAPGRAALAACALAAAAACAGGCAKLTWRGAAPEDMRTVAVPVFRNEGDATGLGSAVARETLREVQREGTFKIASIDDAAVEIRGSVENEPSSTVAYERRTGARNREHRFAATATVSFIDRRAGRVLVENRKYRAETTFAANDDVLTGERNAAGRLAADFARQIVDDLAALDFNKANGKAKE